jgi:hypothetical protein
MKIITIWSPVVTEVELGRWFVAGVPIDCDFNSGVMLSGTFTFVSVLICRRKNHTSVIFNDPETQTG